MSECRALTNIIGNGVATVVVSKWERELDKERLTSELKNPSPDDATGDLHPVREAA
jgi:aerobic C4-dicarboxylate transport protein